MSAPIHILVISDGKAGHENQSLGLAEAMARRMPAEIHLVRLEMNRNPIFRVKQALASIREFPAPDFVIGAGHGTHIALLVIARAKSAKSIVLMKPGLPLGWFDWCVAPEHDFKTKPAASHLIRSKGALNRVVPAIGSRSGKFILIGGPSKIHGFDQAALISQIRERVGDGKWSIADSRRTPADFVDRLKKEVPGLQIFPHRETQNGWLAGVLASAEEVWVTEDSVSMVYEALTGGAKVGILNMPRLKPDARVIRGLESMRAQGYFAEENASVAPPRLAEADRCAALILEASPE